MQKSIAFKTLIIFWIGIISVACDSEDPSSRKVADEFTKPSTSNLAVKKKRAMLKAYFDDKKNRNAATIVEEKKAEAKVAFPYTLAPEFSEIEKNLGEPIGKISGGIYGSENDVYAILKTQCGEGSILQVIFKSGQKFQVSPPIPVLFMGLKTNKVVSYTEGRFKVSVNFSEDTPDKLKGNFRIDFVDDEGNKKVYINLRVDGRPRPYLIPSKMNGKGTLPAYDWCTPTAYVGIKRPEKDWVYGYAHIRNVNKFDLPKIRVMLSDRDGIDLLLVPLKRAQEIPPNTELDIATARKGKLNPAILKVSTWHLDEISEPENATGGNLNKVAKALLLNGKATVALTKGAPWNTDISLKNFSISSLMMGPFQDEAFTEIRIFGNLGEPGSMVSSLPKQPAWWKMGEEDKAAPTEGSKKP